MPLIDFLSRPVQGNPALGNFVENLKSGYEAGMRPFELQQALKNAQQEMKLKEAQTKNSLAESLFNEIRAKNEPERFKGEQSLQAAQTLEHGNLAKEVHENAISERALKASEVEYHRAQAQAEKVKKLSPESQKFYEESLPEYKGAIKLRDDILELQRLYNDPLTKKVVGYANPGKVMLKGTDAERAHLAKINQITREIQVNQPFMLRGQTTVGKTELAKSLKITPWEPYAAGQAKLSLIVPQSKSTADRAQYQLELVRSGVAPDSAINASLSKYPVYGTENENTAMQGMSPNATPTNEQHVQKAYQQTQQAHPGLNLKDPGLVQYLLQQKALDDQRRGGK